MEKRIGIDTYVFIDLFSGEEKAEKVRTIIEDIADGKTIGFLSATGISELYYHLNRLHGEQIADDRVEYIINLPNLVIVSLGEKISLLAGKLRTKYYKKNIREISYIDCMHLATALSSDCDNFVTGDKDFKDVSELNVKII